MAYGSGYFGGYGDIEDACLLPQGLSLDGLTGDYASTPDSAINSLQGTESILELSGFQSTFADIPGNTADIAIGADLELRWEGFVDNFISGAASDQQYLISNYNHNVSGFKLYVSSNVTTLRFQASTAGSNASTASASSLNPGTRVRIRVVRVFTTGAVTFFGGASSIDWLSLPSLGGGGVVFANTIIPNSAVTMKLGSGESTSAFSGRTSNASMIVGGTTIFNPDFSTTPWVIGDVSTQARLDGVGKTWTLRGNSEVVALAERRSLRLSGTNAFTSTKSFSWDFEDGTTNGWQGLSTTITNSATFAHGGTKSLKMVSTVAAGNPAAALTSSGMATSPGESWNASLWIRKDPATVARNLQLKLAFFTSAGGVGFISQNVTAILSSDTFTLFTVSGVAPATANFVRIDVTHTGTVAIGDAHYLDDVALFSGAVNIVGDIDLRVLAVLDDWTPATTQDLCAKFNGTGNQRSWDFKVIAGGNLELTWSADGAATLTATSTLPTGIADGSLRWVRGVLDVDNGAAGRNILFYTSTDGQTWTQLGTTVTQAGVTSIFSSTATLDIGGNTSLNRFVTGNIFYAEVRNGIDGVVVANPDFRKKTWIVGNTSGTFNVDRLGVGWTLNTSGAVIQKAFASDLDIRVKVKLLDLDNGGLKQGFVSSKQGNPVGYGFGMNTSGALELAWGNGGISFFVGVSLAGIMVDGDTKWLRATLDVDDGAGNRVIRFYWSDNGAASWTLFSTVTTAGPTFIADSPFTVLMGANGISFQTMKGVLYYASIRNGIDGVQIVEFNPGAPPWQVGDTSPTARLDQFGNVFTLVGAATIIGPTGDCESVFICGGGYAGGQYASAVYAGIVPCSGPDYPSPSIESNVEEFCILPYSCN